ncbi:MAG: alanine racemase [Aeromicrobium sp.]|uniref:alanine racemase n=1 Tax=Aeromicrobium sp. TaxID=1871063 RepID=UPI0039E2D9D8
MSAPLQAEAYVDLAAYRANIRTLAALAPDARFLAVVKANAYGHGSVTMARAARQAGADWLGVATLDEALALRRAGDEGPLLCWLAAPGADFAAAARHDIEVTASSADQLAEILAASSVPRIQLKVDTGLGRNGAFGDQWTELVAAVRDSRTRLSGVWSHFACADEPGHPANDAQEARFGEAVAELEDAGIDPGLRHLANSAALMTRPSAHLDLVRAGIATYGLPPDPDMSAHPGTPRIDLTPVMTLRVRLAAVKRVSAGQGVSYGHRYVTDRETTLALVPAGYGEGLHRAAGGRAQAWFAGRRVPVVGTICMDQMVVDLGDLPAERGDVLTLFGSGAAGEPTAVDWAAASGTIAYEVVTALGGRIGYTYGEGPP